MNLPRWAAVCAVAALASSGCRPAKLSPWHEEDGFRWRDLAVAVGDVGFTPMDAGRTHVDFQNFITEEQQTRNRIIGHGSGVTIGDVDGDGWADVYLASINGPNVLYRNRGGWRFEDVTERAGVGLADRISTGAVFADVDGDGDLDLLVASLDGPTALLVNDGTGVFEERGEESGLVARYGSSTLALADVDGDGDLDLYVANYKTRAADDVFPPEDRAPERMLVRMGDSLVVDARHRDHYAVVVEPSGFITRTELADPDEFYLNDGTGFFVRVDFTGGRFLDEDGRPLRSTPTEWGLAARFHDLDGDGDVDLYVCNDLETPDRIWLNDGTGVFTAAPWAMFRTTSASSMAVDFSDVDRNGTMDVFVVDMMPTSQRREKVQMPLIDAAPTVPGVIRFRSQRNRNTLFLGRDDGTFQELANYAGLSASNWSWGVIFLDVDLDGYEDLLVNNGHQWDVQHADTNMRIANSALGQDWETVILQYPPLRQRNLAFRNMGDSTFTEMGEAWGFSVGEDISHGIATGDLDGDGDLDVVINRLGSPAVLFRNDAGAPRLTVRLRGRAPNTMAAGAKIRVRGGPVGEQTKEVSLGGIYLSGPETLYSFAAGDAGSLDIVVDWPSGARTVVKDAAPNRVYEIDEPDPLRVTRPPDDSAGDGSPKGLFEDVSDLLGHEHIERVYHDFDRQPLLPNRLSQLGPGLSWHDMDGDGAPDLIVPSGQGGYLTVLLNRAGSAFEPRSWGGKVSADQTTALPFPRGAAGPGLLVGQMNYEAPSPDSALSIPGAVTMNGPGSSRPVLDPAVSTTGPMSMADVDGDGDLDIFVGGRVIPSAYPREASSRVLRNEGGHFELDEGASSVFESVGMVSGSVFSDLDLDGDPDLVLALEWGPLRVFINEGGRFRDASEAWGLDGTSSRWNGVTTGDFNGDGRPDLVATSWGRNTSYEPYGFSAARPLRAYFGDLDGSGTVDVIEAYYDAEVDGYVTKARLERLSRALPFVRRYQTPTFKQFSEATVEEVLGAAFARASTVAAVSFDHLLLINEGGSFTARALPAAAQLAPAFHAGVADFDGDGREDLFLSQNFFPNDEHTFRFDSGRGLVLLGDGTGGFEALSGLRSGVIVYGEQRGAAVADFDGDRRVDLAVSQNGAPTRLFRNQGGRPGLRVRLRGPAGNPDGIGATVRVVYADGLVGPAREIRSGAGYWSSDDPVQILGLAGDPVAVRVRWSWGEEWDVPLQPDQREITIGAR